MGELQVEQLKDHVYIRGDISAFNFAMNDSNSEYVYIVMTKEEATELAEKLTDGR